MRATSSQSRTAPDRLVELARQALTALDDRRLGSWERLGLSVRQIRFLYLLERHRDRPRVTQLADEMRVNPAIITGLTDRLARLGLVVRAADTQDRRVKHVELTRLGRAALAGAPEATSIIRDGVSRLDDAAVLVLTRALEAMDDTVRTRSNGSQAAARQDVALPLTFSPARGRQRVASTAAVRRYEPRASQPG